ncbi:MAG: MFS transporter [Acidimicrobiales bacterium]|nr:MFS transporter [Acidimicrobiales bacterium]
MTSHAAQGPPGTASRLDIDGGNAWWAVAAAAIAHLPVFGTVYGFTVIFDSFEEAFDAGKGATAWIAGIATAFLMGVPALSGRFSDRFGARPLIAVGAVLISAGYLLTSIAQEIWQVYLTFGVLTGLGMSCIILPAVSVVGARFVRRRGLAIGAAVSGSGLATLTVVPALGVLIDHLGWRSALRVLALAFLVVFALALVGLRGHKRAEPGRLSLSVTRERAFWVLWITGLLAIYGYFIPFVFIVPYAEDQGISTGAARSLVLVLGFSALVGRPVMGALCDRVGSRRMYLLTLTFMALGLLAWVLTTNLASLIVFAAYYGFVAGSMPALFPTVTGDYFGHDRMATVAGLLGTGSALGSFVGPATSGLLHDWTDSYAWPAVLGAACTFLAAVLMRFMPPQPETALVSGAADDPILVEDLT